MNTCRKSSPTQNQRKVRILVVDDDKICLAITASVLKILNYEVVTISCPLEALSKLQMNQESFNVVLSDLHMPLINGLEFQTIVEAEYKIPVVLMSADDNKNLLLQSLQNGDAFFIVKPPKIGDLKNIGQYVKSRRTSSTGVEPRNGMVVNRNIVANIYRQPPLHSNNDHQRLLPNVERNENNVDGRSTKKPRLVWSAALDNLFLEAIIVIGIHRAVPKKILEYMNVPGLTRKNIASHLQKYRNSKKRVNQSNGVMQHGMRMNSNERPFRSSFSWNQFSSLANNSFLLNQNPPQGHTSMPYPQSSSNAFNILGAYHPNLSRPSFLQSSILHKDESITAARQFVMPNVSLYANNTRGMLGRNDDFRRPHLMPSHHGILNQFLLINGNNRVMSAQQEGDLISTTPAVDNLSNVIEGQVTAENTVNANLQSDGDARDKEYGTGDITPIISDIEGQNGNNNN